MKVSLPACLYLFSFKALSQVNKAPVHPFIAHYPHFSIWPFANKSTESPAKHWEHKNLSMLRLRPVDQPVLRKKGDDVRTDWEYLYMGTQKEINAHKQNKESEKTIYDFIKDSPEKQIDRLIPRGPDLISTTLLTVPGSNNAENTLLVAYDGIFSIQYINQNLKGGWKSESATIERILLNTYTKLAEQPFDNKISEKYQKMVRGFAHRWITMAPDGDHYALNFDKKGTWSQNYNLAWNKLLRLNLFPQAIYDSEIKYYLTHLNQYRLPLDSRRTYTKSDRTMWTATLANKKTDFEALITPVYKYAARTPSRVTLSDWHETTTGKEVGFQARSVVGGYFIKLPEHKWNN